MTERQLERYVELVQVEDRALSAYVARVRAGLVATAELDEVKRAVLETLAFSEGFSEEELELADEHELEGARA